LVLALVLYKVPEVFFKDENGNDVYRYPLTAKMEIPKLVTYMSSKKSNTQRACKRAFYWRINSTRFPLISCSIYIESTWWNTKR
jgi:hypothetical protein